MLVRLDLCGEFRPSTPPRGPHPWVPTVPLGPRALGTRIAPSMALGGSALFFESARPVSEGGLLWFAPQHLRGAPSVAAPGSFGPPGPRNQDRAIRGARGAAN